MNKTVRPNRIKSYLFVAVQFLSLGLLALTGYRRCANLYA